MSVCILGRAETTRKRFSFANLMLLSDVSVGNTFRIVCLPSYDLMPRC